MLLPAKYIQGGH